MKFTDSCLVALDSSRQAASHFLVFQIAFCNNLTCSTPLFASKTEGDSLSLQLSPKKKSAGFTQGNTIVMPTHCTYLSTQAWGGYEWVLLCC